MGEIFYDSWGRPTGSSETTSDGGKLYYDTWGRVTGSSSPVTSGHWSSAQSHRRTWLDDGKVESFLYVMVASFPYWSIWWLLLIVLPSLWALILTPFFIALTVALLAALFSKH